MLGCLQSRNGVSAVGPGPKHTCVVQELEHMKEDSGEREPYKAEPHFPPCNVLVNNFRSPFDPREDTSDKTKKLLPGVAWRISELTGLILTGRFTRGAHRTRCDSSTTAPLKCPVLCPSMREDSWELVTGVSCVTLGSYAVHAPHSTSSVYWLQRQGGSPESYKSHELPESYISCEFHELSPSLMATRESFNLEETAIQKVCGTK